MLNEDEKKEVLWEHGEHLASVVLDETGYALYSLFDYYVEVTLIEDEIKEVRHFKEGEAFDKYLHLIDIADWKNADKK